MSTRLPAVTRTFSPPTAALGPATLRVQMLPRAAPYICACMWRRSGYAGVPVHACRSRMWQVHYLELLDRADAGRRADARLADRVCRERRNLLAHRHAGSEGAKEAAAALREAAAALGVADGGSLRAAVDPVVTARGAHERAACPGVALAGELQLAAARRLRRARDIVIALDVRSRAWGGGWARGRGACTAGVGR